MIGICIPCFELPDSGDRPAAAAPIITDTPLSALRVFSARYNAEVSDADMQCS